MDIKAAHRPGQLSVGPWGEHTATLDWCEDNYVHFMHVAETWNSFSNIPFILLALHGMYSILNENMPNRTRYALTHGGIAFIGIGSLLFHATLMWHAQVLLDELPMIYVSFQVLYCLLLEGKPSSTRTPKIICTVLPALITAIYLAYPNPVFHQVSYGALQLYITYRVQDLLKRIPDGNGDVGKFKRDCKHLLTTGSLTSILAFGIWNMDNILCENITLWRETVGSIGIMSQGHAWWHILVAIGSNRAVTAIIGLSNGMMEPESCEVVYHLGVFPYLKRRTDVKGLSKQE